jgi:D123
LLLCCVRKCPYTPFPPVQPCASDTAQHDTSTLMQACQTSCGWLRHSTKPRWRPSFRWQIVRVGGFQTSPSHSWMMFTALTAKFADVMDVYVDKRDRVWVVDFSVFGGTTSSLLFSWLEVATMYDGSFAVDTGDDDAHGVATMGVEGQSGDVVWARVTLREGIRPNPLMHHQLPDDFFGSDAHLSVDDLIQRMQDDASPTA